MANRDTEVNNLIINELTKAEFDSAEKSDTELYFVTDEKIQASDIEGLKTINNESIVGTGNIEIKSGVEIDDTTVSTTKVYSSSKVNSLDSNVVHKADSETITGQKTFKLNNSFGNNTLDAIFSNGIFIGDGMATTTSRLFNTRWCNNSFQIKTSQDIGYSYLAGSNTTNYGLKYQVQRMPSRSSQPTSAGVVEAGMLLSYDGLIVGYSNQANVKVNDNEFTYVLDQKNVKTKTIDTLATTDKTIIGAINEINAKPSGGKPTYIEETETLKFGGN